MQLKGEDGYHFKMPLVNPSTGQILDNKKVSCQDLYSYRFMERKGRPNHWLQCQDLLNQFATDQYAKCESERTRWCRRNQKTLRVTEYQHLKDAVMREGLNPDEIGKATVLPSSFIGGPRYMNEKNQDGLCYVRNFGCADLFCTFTCNPRWPEIIEQLRPGQQPHHRQDIIARVFRLKAKRLQDLLTKDGAFGDVRCWMCTCEWQKRGLPHIHMLIWLKERIHLSDIDSTVAAELPDPNEDPELFNIVRRNMVHGPCGPRFPNSKCMINGKCSKKYPRPLVKETQTGEDGYPTYRRRSVEDGGHSFEMKIGGEIVTIDNRWIVPYNPTLSRIFDAHVNLEFCASVKSIKFITKYITKAH